MSWTTVLLLVLSDSKLPNHFLPNNMGQFQQVGQVANLRADWQSAQTAAG